MKCMALPDLSKIDFKKITWYQFLALISAVVLILSLFYPIQVIDQKSVIYFSLGTLCFSIGRWYNEFLITTPYGLGGFIQWKTVKTKPDLIFSFIKHVWKLHLH